MKIWSGPIHDSEMSLYALPDSVRQWELSEALELGKQFSIMDCAFTKKAFNILRLIEKIETPWIFLSGIDPGGKRGKNKISV